MDIKIEKLTKRFGYTKAVDNISFEVKTGEILGFLGPNGAGKTTTMKIITNYLNSDEGDVIIGGKSVRDEADEIKRHIGYLPENNPLYPEMRVREYLKFRARLKGLGQRRLRERVNTVMEQCGLADMGRRIIGQLSKGYRQRVGMADVLVHDPELLILDEPTIGLDPHQIRTVRQLIKNLAQAHTVLISTHILPEAEMMCNRMLIMHNGKILAADTPENLQRLMAGSGQTIVELAAPPDALRECLSQVPEIEHFTISAGEDEFQHCTLTPRDGLDLRPIIFTLALQHGWVLRELTRNRHSLEDIYVQVTKPNEEEEGE